MRSPRRNATFQYLHAVFKRFGKSFFFLLQHRRNARLGFHQFRIGLAHRFRQVLHQQMKERLFLPKLVAVANGATNDAPQHVATPFIAGNHAIGDEEGTGANMVGDYLE